MDTSAWLSPDGPLPAGWGAAGRLDLDFSGGQAYVQRCRGLISGNPMAIAHHRHEGNEPMEESRKIQKLIARAWTDDEFKERLLSDPAARLQEEGLQVPPGIEVRIVEDTPDIRYMVLPLKPSTEELSEEHITKFAGGICEGINCCPTWYQCGPGTYACVTGYCTIPGVYCQ